MRTKTPFRRKRLISRGSSSSTSVEVKVERELQCSRCKAIFPDYLARCPECGSEEWIGLVEVNPYTRMPMETFLKACGHLLWLVGTIGFLVLLWQTDSPDLNQRDRKSTRLNSSHPSRSRMPSSA